MKRLLRGEVEMKRKHEICLVNSAQRCESVFMISHVLRESKNGKSSFPMDNKTSSN